MNCLSKAFSVYARLEFGIGDVKVISPFLFSGSPKGSNKRYEFHCHSENHVGAKLFIPKFKDTLFMLIPNKKGDNFIVLKEADLKDKMNGMVDFKTLANVIKYKTRFETNILHDRKSIVQEG